MTRKLRSIAVTILASLVLSTNAYCQEAPNKMLKAANELASLFSEFLKPFNELGQSAQRDHLIDQLTTMNRSLFNLEQEKRYLIIALKRRPMNINEIRKSVETLLSKIDETRADLSDIAPQLRVAYRPKADEAIRLLTDAIIERKEFLSNVSAVTEATAEKQVSEAEEAVKALDKAQTALADTITALQKQR